MTQSGEVSTFKGEYNHANDSVFSYNKILEVSYRMYLDGGKKIEIRMSHPDISLVENFQMIFVLKGNLRITQNHAEDIEIGSHQHNLCRTSFKSGCITLSSPNDEVVRINLSAEFLKRYIPKQHHTYATLFSNAVNDAALLSATNMQITPEIGAILQRLCNSSQNDFSDQLLLEAKAIELLALQLSQAYQIQNNPIYSPLKQSEMKRMHEAREILINQTGAQLSLRSLAHLVGTNEFNLKRDFKAVFGCTVYGYLNHYKMEKAKSMLTDMDISIAEISNKMGYKHATHFTTAFKKYFGYLPNKIKSIKLSLLVFAEEIIALFEQFDLLL